MSKARVQGQPDRRLYREKQQSHHEQQRVRRLSGAGVVISDVKTRARALCRCDGEGVTRWGGKGLSVLHEDGNKTDYRSMSRRESD